MGEAEHQFDAGALLSRQHPIRLFQRIGHRLFQQDMFARFGRGHRRAFMQMMGQRDVYSLYGIIRQYISIVRHPLDALRFRQYSRAVFHHIADDGYVKIGHIGRRFHEAVGDDARAEDTEFDRHNAYPFTAPSLSPRTR